MAAEKRTSRSRRGRSDESRLRLTRRKVARGAAAARVITPVSSGAVTLEEMLVAFQKSLARATRASFEASRSEAGFGLGEQALYVIDGLNVSLDAGCRAAFGPNGRPSHVVLDFDRPADSGGTARLEFRVQTRPLEPLAGSQIILADLDPLGHGRPEYRLRGTLMLPPPESAAREPGAQSAAVTQALRKLRPQADRAIDVHIVGGDTKKVDVVSVDTNAVGQFEFSIDADRNRFTFGDRSSPLSQVQLREEDDDFFVFATYESDELAEPVVSNIMRFDVKRQPSSGSS
ncbi:MAG: hypothetical protein GC151_17575 [Betaproteobacteria bacterium]|nr:hypothetical protein [Betaproteobacteria bacterium]